MSQKNRIFIIAGQSWAAGQINTIPSLQAPYKDTYLHNTRIWNGTDFYPMYSPDNNNQFPTFASGQTNGCAMEFYFKDIADLKGNDIYILKYARGSTGMAISAGYDWNTTPTQTDLLDYLELEIADVITWMNDRKKDFEWAGLLWLQGENDTILEVDSLAYQSNIQALYDVLCTATSTTLKIWQSYIQLPPSENREFMDNVNAGKLAFTNVDTSNRRVFATNVTDWSADNIHPSVPTGYTSLWNDIVKPKIIIDL